MVGKIMQKRREHVTKQGLKYVQIRRKTHQKQGRKIIWKMSAKKGPTRRKTCEQSPEPSRQGGDNRGGFVTLLLLCITSFKVQASTRPDPQGVGGYCHFFNFGVSEFRTAEIF